MSNCFAAQRGQGDFDGVGGRPARRGGNRRRCVTVGGACRAALPLPHISSPQEAAGAESRSLSSDGRIEILETTIIDADRKLVLMRCDDIEHLVMVGGPADVVVENDVRKVRGPGAPPAKIPGFETEKRARLLDAACVRRGPSISGGAPHQKRPSRERPAADARQALATTSRAPAVQPPLARAGARSAEPHPAALFGGDAKPRFDAALGDLDVSRRREPTPPRRVPAGQNPPPPNRSIPPATQSARPARTNGRAEPGAASAGSADPMVRSRLDRERDRAGAPLRPADARRHTGTRAARASAGKPAMDSSATLGDLADRLEEALAREMQSARSGAEAPNPFWRTFHSMPGEPGRASRLGASTERA